MPKPPAGGDWSHEVKFDGYRSRSSLTRRRTHLHPARAGLNGQIYRALALAAASLGVESAVIDGEVIVLNEAGLSDFGALRKAIACPQHDLYFVAFVQRSAAGHRRCGVRRRTG